MLQLACPNFNYTLYANDTTISYEHEHAFFSNVNFGMLNFTNWFIALKLHLNTQKKIKPLSICNMYDKVYS